MSTCTHQRAGPHNSRSLAHLCAFFSGGAAGAFSRTITAPLDRLRVVIQEGNTARMLAHLHRHRPPSAAKHPALSDFVLHIYEEGGWRSFWKGNGINCMKVGPEFALVFSLRQYFIEAIYGPQRDDVTKPKRSCPWGVCHLSAWPRPVVNFIVGAAAGALAQTTLYPLEVLRTRIAVSSHHEYESLLDCAMQSFKRGGIRDFYRGLGTNLVGIVPFRGVELGTFYTLEHTLRLMDYGWWRFGSERPSSKSRTDAQQIRAKLTVWETLATGMLSSLAAQSLTYPISLARTRLQTQGVNGRPHLYRGMWHCLFTVARRDGLAGLFRGILPNSMKVVPASATAFAVYEHLQAEFRARGYVS